MGATRAGWQMPRSILLPGAGRRNETPPTFWKRLLAFVAVGKAALGGAGAALALAGAFNIATAITAQHWLHDVQKHYLDYIALGGGAVGGTIGIVSRLT